MIKINQLYKNSHHSYCFYHTIDRNCKKWGKGTEIVTKNKLFYLLDYETIEKEVIFSEQKFPKIYLYKVIIEKQIVYLYYFADKDDDYDIERVWKYLYEFKEV